MTPSIDGEPSASRSSRERTETGWAASSGVPGIQEPVTVTVWLKVSTSWLWWSCSRPASPSARCSFSRSAV